MHSIRSVHQASHHHANAWTAESGLEIDPFILRACPRQQLVLLHLDCVFHAATGVNADAITAVQSTVLRRLLDCLVRCGLIARATLRKRPLARAGMS